MERREATAHILLIVCDAFGTTDYSTLLSRQGLVLEWIISYLTLRQKEDLKLEIQQITHLFFLSVCHMALCRALLFLPCTLRRSAKAYRNMNILCAHIVSRFMVSSTSSTAAAHCNRYQTVSQS